MTLQASKSFRELVHNRAAKDVAFAAALLREARAAIAGGDTVTGETLIRDYLPTGAEKSAGEFPRR